MDSQQLIRPDLTIWCCPVCRGSLILTGNRLECTDCSVAYSIIHGIPDLRVELDCWIDLNEDCRRAEEAAQFVEREGLDATICHIFQSSRGMDDKHAGYRTQQVLAGIDKCASQCSDWLSPVVNADGLLLEIGCGPGQMLAAAARLGHVVVGVDVSMEWLVIAKHLITRYGGQAQLAAGLGEKLPIKDGTISAIISLDVIEHVGDQHIYVQEIKRTLAPGGVFALSTPNRYSLSPEPHVHLWGVGYLPRSLQAPYVKLVKKQSYTFTRLLSVWETKKLFSRAQGFDAKLVFPGISDHEIAIFSKLKKRLARIYNRIVELPLMHLLLPFFGAYYRITGRTIR